MDSTNEVIVRPCEPRDAASVMAMSDRLTVGMAPWRDAAALAAAVQGWFAGSTAPDFDGVALVAELADRIVGFVSVSTMGHFAGESDAYIGELVVDETLARRGIGRALIAAAERAAADRGHRCITLTTGAANAVAREFYEALGYRSEDITFTKVLGAT